MYTSCVAIGRDQLESFKMEHPLKRRSLMNTLEFGIEGVLLSRGQGAAINGVVFYEGIHIRDLLLLASSKMVDLFFRVVSNMAIEF